MIPYGRQTIRESDIQAVLDSLRGDYLTGGPVVERFEERVAEYVGAEFAVSFSSATAGLHAAVAVAGLGRGDVLYTSPLTFIASANCGRYVGATPALLDIDPSTLNIATKLVTDQVKNLVAVHFAGLPMDLSSLPHRPDLIIEDAAHALGARDAGGIPVGRCANSDMAVFSFHPVKPITTGEGGMVTTNSREHAESLKRFRSHGIDRTPTLEPWAYDAREIGYNYRLTDIQAALGLSQMDHLDEFIERRNLIAAKYTHAFGGTSIVVPPVAPEGAVHGYHLYSIQVPDRLTAFNRLRAAGIGVQVHYVPVHRHTVSADVIMPDAGLPNCDEVYSGILSLPNYPDLRSHDQDFVIDTLLRIVD
jgi:perosamine synthetase